MFARSGLFDVLPDAGLKPLEELFRARIITFLVDGGPSFSELFELDLHTALR